MGTDNQVMYGGLTGRLKDPQRLLNQSFSLLPLVFDFNDWLKTDDAPKLPRFFGRRRAEAIALKAYVAGRNYRRSGNAQED